MNPQGKDTEDEALKNVDDMPPEYEFDYSRAKPNRFAGRYRETEGVVVLNDGTVKQFSDSGSE